MHIPRRFLALVGCWCACLGFAQSGFDVTKLRSLRATLEEDVAAGRTNGIVALVVHDGRVVAQEAVGWADRARAQPMRPDSLFWIASMTKSISAAAILTLVDEGKLTLDEPAAQWLPELAQVKLENGAKPARPITLRHLLSHTAGLQLPRRSASDGANTLRGYTLDLVRAPLTFEPGSRYEYNFGITVAGRIAEIVSGQRYEAFVADRILRPLRLNDTTFHPDAALRARIVQTYTRAEDGPGLVATYNPFVTPDPSIRHMPEPSGGLFSTAADLARFYQMVLDGGVWNGKRMLKMETVAEMLRPQLAGTKRLNYGLGWMVNGEGRKPMTALPVGAYGHAGAFFTNGWIIPNERLIAIMLMEQVHVPESAKARDRFYELVSASVRE